ncbi:MAG: hypothetical protein CL967_05720 [Euryarchaeota archaeon]|nr:hypothetical protein [Euryarchaeota archaeon]
MNALALAYVIGAALSAVPRHKSHPMVQYSAFHFTSAMWYAVWFAVRRTQSSKKYLQSTTGLKLTAPPLGFSEKAWFALSCALQFPLSPAAATMFPFFASCAFGLKSVTHGSNVAMFAHTLLFGTATLFSGWEFILPAVLTTISFSGFAHTGYRATAPALWLATGMHIVLGVCALVLHGVSHSFHSATLLETLLACFAAACCCEARIAAFQSVRDTRWDVTLASRYAAVCSAILPFFVLETQSAKEKVSSVAVFLFALSTPWFAGFHQDWRKEIITPSLPKLSLSFVCLVCTAVIALTYRYIYLNN